jgi:hypothetical protein
MGLPHKERWSNLVRKTVGKGQRFQRKPCNFQLLALMRCLSSHDGGSEKCLDVSRAYLSCMKNKGRADGHASSAPQLTKYAIRKKKLRKRGVHHPD